MNDAESKRSGRTFVAILLAVAMIFTNGTGVAAVSDSYVYNFTGGYYGSTETPPTDIIYNNGVVDASDAPERYYVSLESSEDTSIQNGSQVRRGDTILIPNDEYSDRGEDNVIRFYNGDEEIANSTITFAPTPSDGKHSAVLNQPFPTGEFNRWELFRVTTSVSSQSKLGTMSFKAAKSTSDTDQETVTYNANGGTGTMTDTKFFSKGYGTVAACTYTREGYEFQSWNTASNGQGRTYAANAVIYCSETLYAQWAQITANRTVTYNSNGGSGNQMPDLTFAASSSGTVASCSYTRAGYTFSGWNTASDGSGKPYAAGATINSSETLYAQWNSNKYIVSFNSNGGSGSISPRNVTYDTFVTLSSSGVTKAGCSLIGWSKNRIEPPLSAGEELPEGAVEVDESKKWTLMPDSGNEIILYAVWRKNSSSEETGSTEIVTFYGNGETGGLPVGTMTFKTGEWIEAPKCTWTRTGYTFSKWNTRKDGKGDSYAVGDFIRSTVKLYAMWVEVPDEIPSWYTAYFYSGSQADFAFSMYLTELKYVLPEWNRVKPENSVFEYWLVNGVKKKPGDEISVDGDQKIIAIWKKLKVSMTYISEMQTGNIKNQSELFDPGASVTLPDWTPAEPGRYLFDGWRINGVKYKAGDQVTLKDDTIAYAEWKDHIYAIKWETGGANLPANVPESYAYKEGLNLNNIVLKKTGYVFLGWYTGKTGGCKVKSITRTATGEKTLYARFKKVSEERTLAQYVIQYILGNDEKNSEDNQAAYYGGIGVAQFSPAEKPGYDFVGWFNAANEMVTGIAADVFGDITLHPVFQPGTYQITYQADGGTYPGGNPVAYTYGEGTDGIYSAYKKGYEFKGWYTESGGKGNLVKEISKTAYGDITLYAHYEKSPDLANAKIILKNGPNFKYTGIKQKVEIDKIKLSSGQYLADLSRCKITGTEAKDPGQYKVTVEGDGDTVTGKCSVGWEIQKVDLDRDVKITLEKDSYTYKQNQPQTPKVSQVVIKKMLVFLKEGRDFTVQYSSADGGKDVTSAGSKYAIISAKDGSKYCKGSAKVAYTIKKATTDFTLKINPSSVDVSYLKNNTKKITVTTQNLTIGAQQPKIQFKESNIAGVQSHITIASKTIVLHQSPNGYKTGGKIKFKVSSASNKNTTSREKELVIRITN